MTTDPGSDRWDASGPGGSTPLSQEEADGLRLSWVATRADLNQAEQESIASMRVQRRWRTMPVATVLDDQTARDLHRAMFAAVWKWAGTYRLRDANIGSHWPYHLHRGP